VLLPRFHPATIAAPARAEFARGLPRPLADLVLLTRRPRAYSAASAWLAHLVRGAGERRLWSVQRALARVLRRVEQQHGAIERSRGRRG
jgi:hypothetical protein